jgi:hypothetical protein
MGPGLAVPTTVGIPEAEAQGDLMALPDPVGVQARIYGQTVLADPMGLTDLAEPPDLRAPTGIETAESRTK